MPSRRESTEKTEITEQTEGLLFFPSVPLFPSFPYSLFSLISHSPRLSVEIPDSRLTTFFMINAVKARFVKTEPAKGELGDGQSRPGSKIERRRVFYVEHPPRPVRSRFRRTVDQQRPHRQRPSA